MSERSVHITFGPVQDFLAQARRTRDLWTGSYLLSYLAASALVRVSVAPNQLVLPATRGNPLVEALQERRSPRQPGDRVGSVPHVAELVAPAEQAKQVAEDAVAAWGQAWTRVSEVVHQYIRPRFRRWTEETDEIWERQVNSLWTHAWVLGDASGMAGRKSLRNFDLRDEPGEKCTCCGAREPLHTGDGSRRGVADTWADVATNAEHRLDLSPEGRERLCAVCTIKRFLPHVAQQALGWNVPVGFPSTTTMASMPWRSVVLAAGADDPDLRAAVALHCEALAGAGLRGAVSGRVFAGLGQETDAWPGVERDAARDFLTYDGDWFYPGVAGDPERAGTLEPGRSQQIRDTLDELHRCARAAGVPPIDIHTYYALLAMDGDRMGQILRDNPDKGQVSRALGAFSRRVADIVEGPDANGVLIYAGGDDVLALLPMTMALSAAAGLRASYRDAFNQHLPAAFKGSSPPSISAGLVYAHMNTPLQHVVRTAHGILEEDAKNKANRDALAVAVWKRPGLVLRFASKWDNASVENGLVQEIETVRDGLRNGSYSRSFVYHLRHLLGSVDGLSDSEMKALLAAEYLRSRERVATREEAESRMDAFQRLSGRAWEMDERMAPALLAAFLASTSGVP